MENDLFIKKFAEQFEDLDGSTLNSLTIFKELDGWSSLTALSVIGMIDEEYNVNLRGDDIINSSTIEDLYNVVKSKL